MNEPMGHLFYYTHRIPNRLMLPKIKASLAYHWDNPRFNQDFVYDDATNLEIVLENHLFENTHRLENLGRELDLVKKNSFIYRLRKRYRSFRKMLKTLPTDSNKKQLNSGAAKVATLTAIKVNEKADKKDR